ncbi:hypothetical protein GCM10009582_25080 [Arthrobacter flavus]
MRTGRTLWFIVAALCVAVAAVIFAGRTTFIENFGDPAYRALIITAYVLLGGAAGSLTRAFSVGKDARE